MRNRHARRADAARGQQPHAPAGLFRGCKPSDIARSVALAEQAQQPGLAELLRELLTGTFSLVSASGRTALVNPDELARAQHACVVLIGDDDYASSGPAGWRCAETIAAWARCAVIHAAGASAETYHEAVQGARLLGRAALIETDTAHAEEWASLFVGKPALLVLPREGAHPVLPPRSAMQ
jgi:hypothetical protein